MAEINQIREDAKSTPSVDLREPEIRDPTENSTRERTTDERCVVVESSRQDNQLEDAELDDLLENALQDFDKVPSQGQSHSIHPVASGVSHISPTSQSDRDAESSLPSGVKHSPSKSLGNQSLSGALGGKSGKAANRSDFEVIDPHDAEAQEAMFNQIFGQASQSTFPTSVEGMESLIKSLMGGNFDDLDLGDLSEESGDISDTLQHTLGSMAENAQGLVKDEMSEDELVRMLSGLAAGGGMDGAMGGEEGSEEGEFMPMMQGFMKNLLSRDVLYPSLKEISAQYPAWLAANKGVVNEKDYDKYERQFLLMTAITDEFESESSTDSEDVKRRRFERILAVMQQMQELGHPPKEIVGEIPRGLDGDENGLPKMLSQLANPEQCNIM